MASRLPAPFGYATATRIDHAPDGSVSVRYHGTDVATLHPDGSVTLRTGGWQTVTTKRRINQAFRYFDVPFRLYQHRHAWYVAAGSGEPMPFVDGMVLATLRAHRAA